MYLSFTLSFLFFLIANALRKPASGIRGAGSQISESRAFLYMLLAYMFFLIFVVLGVYLYIKTLPI